MQTIAIAALVIVMMAAIGLRTDAAELRVVLGRPGRLAALLIVNLVVVPAAIYALVIAAALPAEVGVGFMLCAASPGGATGPLFAGQARGHLGLAALSMILLAMISVVTAPPTVALTIAGAAHIETGHLLLPMMATLAGFQLLPLLAGMAVRRWRRPLAERLAGPANRLASLLLLAIVVGLCVAKGELLSELGGLGVGLCVAFVAIGLVAGALVTRDPAMRRSAAMVTAVRNISLALLLAATYFPAALTDATILSLGLFCMVIPMIVAIVWRRGGGDPALSPA